MLHLLVPLHTGANLNKDNCRGEALVNELGGVLSITLKTVLGFNVLVLIKIRRRQCNL